MKVFKLKSFIKYHLAIIIILIITSCEKKSCVDNDLNKMEKTEVMKIFQSGDFPNINQVTYLNENCVPIPKDSILTKFGFAGNYFCDIYTNSKNEIKVVKFRKSTEKDRKFVKNLRDSVKLLNENKKIRQSEVTIIDIDCTNKSEYLKEVYIKDQNNRINSTINKSIDDENLSIVVSILENCKMSSFVKSDYKAIWVVLQHSNVYFMKKYLHVLKYGSKEGLLPASRLALMEDRILVSDGKPQIYGSQVYRDSHGKWHVYPIKDDVNVDKRRMNIGMQPLKDYLSKWGIVYK